MSQLDQSGINGGLVEKLVSGGFVKDHEEGTEFVYVTPEGATNGFSRIRLKDPKGKAKYIQEKGTGCHLYFASAITKPSSLKDENSIIFICEGEKKALALHQRLEELPDNNRCVIGLGGVWNWVDKEKAGTGKKLQHPALLSEFSSVALKGRTVYIVFDSDIESNQSVRQAESSLASLLRQEGANVRLVTLGPELKAIDDWLVHWGSNWKTELMSLCGEAVDKRPGVNYSILYKQVFSMEQMLSEKFPIPQFFVGGPELGLVGEGMITIVHGPTNLGKTYFSTQMAYSIATGQSFLGHPTIQSRVLMLQGELPPGLYAESRLKPIVRGGYPIPQELLFLNFPFDLGASSRFKETFSNDNWSGFMELERLVERHQPKVIFIDPLQSYNNLVESSNDQNREFLKRLKKLAMSWNLAIVAVDHDKKDASGGIDDVRGASAKTDLLDCGIGLRPTDDDSGNVLMAYDKVRYISTAKPKPVRIHLFSPFFSRVE